MIWPELSWIGLVKTEWTFSELLTLLNDYRNFETVVERIKANGKHFQGCICYTMTEPRMGGEVYNIDYYVNKAKALEEMGADTICIKDMAGLCAPYDAYQIVKALKETCKAPIHLHSHFTSGMSPMTHLKAIEAGVDIIDTCMSPYAYRTSHAAIEPLVMTLVGTNRDTGFDIKLLGKINEILEKEVMPKYAHLLDDSKMSIIDINVLLHQTPGGMLPTWSTSCGKWMLWKKSAMFTENFPG
jgi:pyruvate carboxylase subunit B